MVQKRAFNLLARKRLSDTAASPPQSPLPSSASTTTATSAADGSTRTSANPRTGMLRYGLGRLSSAVAYTTGVEYPPPVVTSKSLGADPVDDSVGAVSPFNFGKMVCAFEAVTFPTTADVCRVSGGLPHTANFLSAMEEVILLFDHLGSAFTFVRRDISSKTHILRQYSDANPARFADLQCAVNAEVAAGTADSKPPPSAARTLLRLMWALKFIDVLLGYLRETLKPNSNIPVEHRTLRAAVAEAYDQALAEHHSWALRKTVRTALALLPTMDTFVHKIGATPKYLARLETSMTPIVASMYRFYEKNSLLELS